MPVIAGKEMEATMSAVLLIVVVVMLAVALIVPTALVTARARKRAALRQRFGPEYDRVVAEEGGRRGGERRLVGAAHKRDSLDVRDLTGDERVGFVERWRGVQAEFVDQPATAARHADELINEVARARGYPTVDDEERADLLAADHPEVMARYHKARDLRANASGGDTEALRGAVVRYRALFEELVGGGSAKPVVEPAPDQAKPDQAKPDQAKPDQAKPDQAKPDQARSVEPPADGNAAVPVAAGSARYDPR
jgi:hypothetical protein